MKVLILNPPSPEQSYINRDQMGGMGQKISFGRDFSSRLLSAMKSEFIHIPVMQLVYAASILEKEHDVRVIDAMNQGLGLKVIGKAVEEFQPDYVFMAVSSSGIMFERDVVARRIKELAPKAKVVTIGDTVSMLPKLLREPFDIGIIGECEKPAVEICQGRLLSKIKGVMYMDGKLRVNKAGPLLTGKQLERLPFPKWELFPYRKYRYYPILLKKPVAPILSSRGCPFGCHYCSYSKNMGRTWRARSAKSVVKEIERNEGYGFKGAIFRDPLFGMSVKRVEEMARLIKEKCLDVEWVCETKPELLSIELLDRMYEAGCRGINVGIESVTPRVLMEVGRRPVDLDSIRRVISHAERIGIRITCFFVLGLPGSDRKSIQRTIEFAKDLNPSHAEFKVATPYPGTKLYERAVRNRWIVSEEYDKLGGYSSAMQISRELNPEYLDAVSGKAFEDFYFRRRWIFREFRRRSLLPKMRMVAETLSRALGRML